jgi:hypothetical protein
MSGGRIYIKPQKLAPFNPESIKSNASISYIGSGSIGGKASALAYIENTITLYFKEKTFEGISAGIPRFIVIATDYFDQFLEQNNLLQVARSYNFYPMGSAKPEEGVVSLALGLGKTIVDGHCGRDVILK